jgi:HD-GYP domain-containing protein (c-di-GMP phosphodiesterase class II)
MGRHVQIGARIGAELGADNEILRLILHHHTPTQSAGIPGDRLRIPQAAYLLSVADALVSMMSDRPYCGARTPSQALAELRRHTGTQFDSISVDAAHSLYRKHQAA